MALQTARPRRYDVTFPQLTLHRGKDRVHFSTGFLQKENIVYTDFSYEKQVGYFGT
jgi:hypothetical protein